MRKNPVIVYTASLILFLILALHSFSEDTQPEIVNAPEGRIPSDAVVLFDGTGLSEWIYTDGRPAGWIVSDGSMTVRDGGIMTRKEFGDIQLHLEFATPAEAKGEGQDRGNSGVYFQSAYEVQVLDSFGNETYIDGMCGAVYEQYPPLTLLPSKLRISTIAHRKKQHLLTVRYKK